MPFWTHLSEVTYRVEVTSHPTLGRAIMAEFVRIKATVPVLWAPSRQRTFAVSVVLFYGVGSICLIGCPEDETVFSTQLLVDVGDALYRMYEDPHQQW